MSDPMTQRPAPAPGTEPLPADVPPRRSGGASMVLWILLLLAIIATAWYFLGRHDATEVPPDATPIGETTPAPSESPVSTEPAARDQTVRERAAPALPNRDARPLSQSAPEYPGAAMRAGEEGTVMVEVAVGADGSPTDVSIAQRSGSRELDRAALQAVRGWTFEPAIRDGQAVASTVQVPVDFRLDTQ
ncbi:energy transducer TonB [Luteimonas kalidii]|uniref:Protein TonB n=1 Tax=Luteimonas kalidii TaxID=3042025 RepID=A0ABT6JUM9_9GAMM|nr:energy transducer TonB [Luteimonas kalidii]MDH5833661.1 energy transducer TonB [Luteimonas kalidii]